MVYFYVTGNNQTPGVYHVTFDVSQWAGKEIELDFWVADENDGVVDSAFIHRQSPHICGRTF